MHLIEVVVIDRLGIRNFFTIWHSATLELSNKPAPDVYLGTARKLGAVPERCIAFEDSGNGLRSAHAAGMLTVAVPADYEFDDPKFSIATIKIPALTMFADAVFQEISRT
jgi:mannitol-1-/sugar-/sorbitol-6-/2-deoxyglucose-6-phosphatase